LPLHGKDTGSLDEKIELMLEKACPSEGEGITDKIFPMHCDGLWYFAIFTWRIYNFWCSMLVFYTNCFVFYLHFVAFLCIFQN
jgi:hypothetical protein